MIRIPNLLLVGSTGRDSGKTVFACELVRRFSALGPVTGVKVTTVQERDGKCPHGGDGCGTCSSLQEDFLLTEEVSAEGGKDTQRLLASGAQRVLWLRVLRDRLDAGARALADQVGEEMVIGESNSLRRALEPGLFFMLRPRGSTVVKPSARQVLSLADQTILSTPEGFDFDWDALAFEHGCWQWKVRR